MHVNIIIKTWKKKKPTKLHLNFPKGSIRNVRLSSLRAQFRTPQMMEINKLGLHVTGARREKKKKSSSPFYTKAAT